MTVSLFQRYQVKDFDKWLNPDPEGLAQMMKSQGAVAYRLFRNEDDPNEVLIQIQFPDRDTLNSYQKWYEGMAVEWDKMHPDGAQKIVQNWVGAEFPGYTRTL